MNLLSYIVRERTRPAGLKAVLVVVEVEGHHEQEIHQNVVNGSRAGIVVVDGRHQSERRAHHNEELGLAVRRIFQADDAELPLRRADWNLAISLLLIRNPSFESRMRGFREPRSKLPDHRHVVVGRRELQLLGDLRDLVDQVGRGAITAPDLVLLNHLEALSGNPVLCLNKVSNLLF